MCERMGERKNIGFGVEVHQKRVFTGREDCRVTHANDSTRMRELISPALMEVAMATAPGESP